MTLYELMNGLTLQGNIEIKVFDEADNEKETRCFRDMGDLIGAPTDDLEDLEVTYMYATKGPDGTEWMVIELKEEEDA